MDRSREIRENGKNPENPEKDTDSEVTKESPIVFQCNKCRTILGDSMTWLSMHEKLSMFTLKDVTESVRIEDKLTMSQEGVDFGSTYQILRCAECKQSVGKMYITTPESLDDLRNRYNLHISAVDSYSVGSASQKSPDDEQMEDDGFLSTEKIRFLTTQLRKMQSMVVMLNSRMAVLENACLEEVDDGEEGEDDYDDDDEEYVSDTGQGQGHKDVAPPLNNQNSARKNDSNHSKKTLKASLNQNISGIKTKRKHPEKEIEENSVQAHPAHAQKRKKTK